MSMLARLQQWYAQQCDGEWEHGQGISIESCDNPGWWVRVNLAGTKLRHASFPAVAENLNNEGFQSDERWFSCQVRNGCWEGAGDETKLEQILTMFLDWAESTSK
jgi:hypothetical protein